MNASRRYIVAVAWSPDGGYLAAVTGDNAHTVHVFKLNLHLPTPPQRIFQGPGHKGEPPQVFGIFVTSTDIGFVQNVGGGLGTLCLGGTIGRYQGPGQILATGSTGSTELAIDLTALPQGNVAVAAQPGQTWYFQFWHRDIGPGSSGWNTSSAVTATFQP